MRKICFKLDPTKLDLRTITEGISKVCGGLYSEIDYQGALLWLILMC